MKPNNDIWSNFEYKTRNIFLKSHTKDVVEKLVLGRFTKTQN